MAIYKLYPYKDTTLYSFYPDANTGLDPIIEVGSPLTTQASNNQIRTLIAFDQTEINSILINRISSSLWQANLKCFVANAAGINSSNTLYIYPLSGSWNNGSGQFGDNPITTNGASWAWKTYSSGSAWSTSSYSSYVTASFLNINQGGGNWYTGSSNPNLNLISTQSFDIRSEKDINTNVTDIVKVWYSSSNGLGAFTSINNDGFIIKWDDNTEFSNLEAIQPYIKSFSIDTHTIYPPELEFRWRDFSFSTGSSTQTIINNSQIYASINNNPGYFYPTSINRFRINCRPQNPTRLYQTSSVYTNNYYLPTASYYAIKDLDTNEYIIDFDTNYTQISADSESNYFDIYMNGLQPERYYKILIKTTISNNTIILDNNYYFKIING